MLTRRHIFFGGASAVAFVAAGRILALPSDAKPAETFEIAHSDAEWRALLTRAPTSCLGTRWKTVHSNSPPKESIPGISSGL